MEKRTLIEQLDFANDETEVRERLAFRQYYSEQVPIIQEWLRRKEEARSAASSAKRDAREKETLSIAKEANAIARSEAAATQRSARYAMYAATIAAISAIIAAKAEIYELIPNVLP